MIDWHSHILPATDDGPIEVTESIAMAARLAEFGYRTVCCTPHCIKGYYDHTPQQVREATLMLQADLDNADIELELWPGMEYMLDECFADFAHDLLPLGDTRLILCEAPQQANPHVVVEGLQRILTQGFFPLIAHPERTELFYDMLTQSNPAEQPVDVVTDFPEESPLAQVETQPYWKRFLPFSPKPNSKFKIQNLKFPLLRKAKPLPAGCLFQANLGSFTGFYGETVQRRAYRLLKARVYTCVASDLHDSRSAPAVLDRDKLETNPLLHLLACFDGEVAVNAGDGDKGQGELF